MIHSGHYNALRQARKLGDYLVVGIVCQADVLINKGPTVFNDEERCSQLSECKWVDEVHVVDTYDV